MLCEQAHTYQDQLFVLCQRYACISTKTASVLGLCETVLNSFMIERQGLIGRQRLDCYIDNFDVCVSYHERSYKNHYKYKYHKIIRIYI